MKKNETKTIKLSTQTVRVLHDENLSLIAAGRGSATVGGSCKDNTTCCSAR